VSIVTRIMIMNLAPRFKNSNTDFIAFPGGKNPLIKLSVIISL
jgi:hypothetical protein